LADGNGRREISLSAALGEADTRVLSDAGAVPAGSTSRLSWR